MKILDKWGTRKKTLVIGGTVILLGSVGVFGFKQYDNQKRVEAAQEFSTKTTDFKRIQKEVDSYVLEAGYLSKNVSSDQLEKNSTQLKQLKEFPKTDYINDKERKTFIKKVVDTTKQVDLITTKLTTQNKLNALFEGDVITEEIVKNDGVVKEEVQSVELDLADFKTEDDWLKSVKKELEEAKNQISVKSEATKSVETFFSQDKVKEGVTRKQYEESVKQVDAVKNKKIQEKLKLRLSVVDKELKRLDKVAKEKAETEAKKAGGTVEKKADGSYVVVPPKQEASQSAGSVAATNEANHVSNGSISEPSSNGPVTNNSSEAPANNSTNYPNGGQSSGNVTPSNGGNSSTNAGSNASNSGTYYYEDYNPFNGGTWEVSGGYKNLEDIPGIEFNSSGK